MLRLQAQRRDHRGRAVTPLSRPKPKVTPRYEFSTPMRGLEYLGEAAEIHRTTGDAYIVHWVTDGRGDYSVVQRDLPGDKRLVCTMEESFTCIHVKMVANYLGKKRPNAGGPG